MATMYTRKKRLPTDRHHGYAVRQSFADNDFNQRAAGKAAFAIAKEAGTPCGVSESGLRP